MATPTPSGLFVTPAPQSPACSQPAASETLFATDEDENPIILDPKNSERQYWREPLTGIIREIWRPGDGDGEKSAEYADMKKTPDVPSKRWKFYQLSTGAIDRYSNCPPKFVVLDDRAAYEILQSNIPRSHLVENWNLDFGGPGTVRQRREHRGRGVIGDPDAEGNDKYHFGYHANKRDRYYFCGEPKDTGFRPVIYSNEQLELARKRRAELEASHAAVLRNVKKRKGGHNQWTPEHLKVKNGAPSKAKRPPWTRAHVNTFLRKSPSPELGKDKTKEHGWTAGAIARERFPGTANSSEESTPVATLGESRAFLDDESAFSPAEWDNDGKTSMWDRDEEIDASAKASSLVKDRTASPDDGVFFTRAQSSVPMSASSPDLPLFMTASPQPTTAAMRGNSLLTEEDIKREPSSTGAIDTLTKQLSRSKHALATQIAELHETRQMLAIARRRIAELEAVAASSDPRGQQGPVMTAETSLPSVKNEDEDEGDN